MLLSTVEKHGNGLTFQELRQFIWNCTAGISQRRLPATPESAAIATALLLSAQRLVRLAFRPFWSKSTLVEWEAAKRDLLECYDQLGPHATQLDGIRRDFHSFEHAGALYGDLTSRISLQLFESLHASLLKCGRLLKRIKLYRDPAKLGHAVLRRHHAIVCLDIVQQRGRTRRQRGGIAGGGVADAQGDAQGGVSRIVVQLRDAVREVERTGAAVQRPSAVVRDQPPAAPVPAPVAAPAPAPGAPPPPPAWTSTSGQWQTATDLGIYRGHPRRAVCLPTDRVEASTAGVVARALAADAAGASINVASTSVLLTFAAGRPMALKYGETVAFKHPEPEGELGVGRFLLYIRVEGAQGALRCPQPASHPAPLTPPTSAPEHRSASPLLCCCALCPSGRTAGATHVRGGSRGC